MLGRLWDEGISILKSNHDWRENFGALGTANSNVATQKSLNKKLDASKPSIYHEEEARLTSQLGQQATTGRSDRVIKNTQRKAGMAAQERERMASLSSDPSNFNPEGGLSKQGLKTMQKGQANALEQHKAARSNAFGKIKDDAIGYFTEGDFTQNAVRGTAAVGALGAAAVGTRYLSGGSATHNNQGRRDIAGIPFI